MRGSIRIGFSRESLLKFKAGLEVAVRNVNTGSRKATTIACKEILAESLAQVPRETSALADSAFYEVTKRTDIKSIRYEGIVGYGANNLTNPKSFKPVSEYMVAVHERLDVVHPVGKAKFLEDPVRAYGSRHYKRVVFENMREALRKI